MTGKILAGVLVLSAIAMGIGLWYTQIYAFYEPVNATGSEDVQMTLLATGEPEAVLYQDFEAIDAESSPIRYRACFTTTMSQALMTETYQSVEKATPLNAPGWFDCFDAAEIGAALQSGEALAFMGVENISYGIDRIVAVMPDGRGFSWHEINTCGKLAFDGEDLPATCPPKPEGQ